MASEKTRKEMVREVIDAAILQAEKLPSCKARSMTITYLETAALWLHGGNFAVASAEGFHIDQSAPVDSWRSLVAHVDPPHTPEDSAAPSGIEELGYDD